MSKGRKLHRHPRQKRQRSLGVWRVQSDVSAKMLALVKRPDAGSLYDRTLAGCVRSVLTYADVRRTEETLCDRTLAVSGQA